MDPRRGPPMDELDRDEPAVQLNKSTANVVVVDNVPRTEMKRYEKLYAVIRKIFSQYGTIIDDGLYIPVEGDPKMTCGYAFIEYETQDMAMRAVVEGNMKKLDNAHTLLVNPFDDFDKYGRVTEEYVPPKKSDYESKVNLNSWLLDERGRDMFVLRHGTETQVFYNDPYRLANDYGRDLKYEGDREKARGKRWADFYVTWSTKGSYLLTFHEPGCAIWGGENFERLGRFPHHLVSQIEFSPNERYLVTSNGIDRKGAGTAAPAMNEPECYIVWDVRAGKKLRGFDKEKGEGEGWPIFKWSHNDKYVARKGEGLISVYETPAMGLLDKKSLKVANVADFEWSPSNTLMSYWVPEKSNAPATVAIVEFPSRQVKREKHLYNVVDIKMHWHPQGDYLCVKVSRRKSKKTLMTNFEIFRMRSKDIPIETLELETNIVAFAWEPHGHKFAIIHTGSAGSGNKNTVSIYDVKGKKVRLSRTFESRAANALFWSPLGGHLVLAGFGPFNGALEWIDVDGGESLTPQIQEHFKCTEVEWDPSGRFVITSATQPIDAAHWAATMDNGYNLWSMQGQLLVQCKIDQCYQVMWRPRPTGLLSKEQIAQIKAELKEKYWHQFEKEDEAIRQSQLTGAAKEKAELKAAWKAYRQQKEKEIEEEKQYLKELRGGLDSDNEEDYVTVEQTVEEEISREEEPLQ